MTEHRYPKDSLVRDYLRAAGGSGLMAMPFITAEPGPIAGTILGLGVILFTVYGVTTWQRHNMTIRVSTEGILADRLFGKFVEWNQLDALKLSYFSTTRDRRQGWMQIILTGGGSRLKFDSTLQDFDQIVARAVQAAEARRLQLSPPTVENLRSLGIEFASAESQEEGA